MIWRDEEMFKESRWIKGRGDWGGGWEAGVNWGRIGGNASVGEEGWGVGAGI